MSRLACPRCQRPLSHCLCALIPHLNSRTRILILQHPDEQKHALNTARLAYLGLENAALWVGEHFAELPAFIENSPYAACVLFPGESAAVLKAYTPTDTPRLLIVPDGTWRKARKLMYLNPVLERLPKVTLGAAAPSRYRLRKAPSAESLATLEAITQALEALEGQDFSPLLKPFEALIDGQIQAMGEAVYLRNHLK